MFYANELWLQVWTEERRRGGGGKTCPAPPRLPDAVCYRGDQPEGFVRLARHFVDLKRARASCQLLPSRRELLATIKSFFINSSKVATSNVPPAGETAKTFSSKAERQTIFRTILLSENIPLLLVLVSGSTNRRRLRHRWRSVNYGFMHF